MSLLQALPLTLFLVILRTAPPKTPTDWQLPFIAAGLAALAVIAIMVLKKKILNRIFLGINLYFFTGGLAFVTHQFWLNDIYGHLTASGMLLWVAAVGLITTMATPTGFIAEDHPDKSLIKKYSGLLIAATLIAAFLSYGFRDSHLLSEIAPFTGLFIIYGMLKNKLAEQNGETKNT
jgi:predicted neutral ceramidase superfamily lipid hydrolase